MPTIADRIRQYNANRQPDVLPLKYKAMAESPFRFFRGSAHLFYEDLAAARPFPFPASPVNWLSGDLHFENFGSYRDRDQQICFTVNDFEEAALAPVLLELSRLLVSIHLAGIQFNLSAQTILVGCEQLLKHFNKTILHGEAIRVDGSNSRGLIQDLVEKVAERSDDAEIKKRTDNAARGAMFLTTDTLLPIPSLLKSQLIPFFTEWFNTAYSKTYTVTDAGFRIAGTGSIGVRRYCCLLEHEENPQRKRLLDLKECMPSSLVDFMKVEQPLWTNEAERIIGVQQRMQFGSPKYLAPLQFDGRWFVVRELQPSDDKVNVAKNIDKIKKIASYVEDLGEIVASAQLRCSGYMESASIDELKDFARDKSWPAVVINWSRNYAQQVIADHHSFCSSPGSMAGAGGSPVVTKP